MLSRDAVVTLLALRLAFTHRWEGFRHMQVRGPGKAATLAAFVWFATALLSAPTAVRTTALVLAMIEDGFLTTDLSAESPVAALRAVSHDPTCRATVDLHEGGRATAIEVQWEFLRLAQKYADDFGLDVCGGDDVGGQVLTRWEAVLGALERAAVVAHGRLSHERRQRIMPAW